MPTLGLVWVGGLELGVALYQGQVVQLRNTLSLESKAAKLLQDESFDTNILGLYEKLSLGIFGGGSISSYIGLPYFRPYLFVGAGFGLVSVRLASPSGDDKKAFVKSLESTMKNLAMIQAIARGNALSPA